jgi:putative endonuclease
MGFVYILKSKKKDWIYVGATNNLKQRLIKHNKRLVKSTKFYAPFSLVYYEAYVSYTKARSRENELKNHSQKREQLYKRIGLV